MIVCEHTVQCANDVCVCVSVVYPITLRLIIVIAIYSMETDRTVFFYASTRTRSFALPPPLLSRMNLALLCALGAHVRPGAQRARDHSNARGGPHRCMCVCTMCAAAAKTLVIDLLYKLWVVGISQHVYIQMNCTVIL